MHIWEGACIFGGPHAISPSAHAGWDGCLEACTTAFVPAPYAHLAAHGCLLCCTSARCGGGGSAVAQGRVLEHVARMSHTLIHVSLHMQRAKTCPPQCIVYACPSAMRAPSPPSPHMHAHTTDPHLLCCICMGFADVMRPTHMHGSGIIQTAVSLYMLTQ